MLAALRLVAVLLVLALTAPQSRADNDGSLYGDIYLTLDAANPCVRLLTVDGTVGCATPSGGWTGTLRNVETSSELTALLNEAPDYRVAVVLHPSLLSASNVDSLHARLGMAGIIVTSGTDGIAAMSPATSSPQAEMRLDKGTAAFDWNPVGDGLDQNAYPFAIILVDEEQSASVLRRARKNEHREREDEYPAFAAEFKYEMFGKQDSARCLDDRMCLPIGGHSVWVSMDGSVNDTRPAVLGITHIDASSMFHDDVIGAESAMSGTIALLGAFNALSVASETIDFGALPKHILLGFFNAESWGYAGSRKFVDDVQNFECEDLRTSNGKEYCRTPYKPDLEFTHLSLDRIDAAVELNQVGLVTADTVYAHRQHDGNAETTALINTIQSEASGLTSFTVADGAGDTDGVPPSSLMSFLRERSSIPAVVLADHEREYVNDFFHSRLDNDGNFANPGGVACGSLCKLATTTARSLFRAAGGSAGPAAAIEADPAHIASLYECLVEDFSCPLVRKYLPSSQKKPLHYAGVYVIREEATIGGTARFIHDLIADSAGNHTVHFHDAVDPVLEFDASKGKWLITNTTVSPVWTESNWLTTATRVFERENPATAYAMLGTGIGITLLSFPAFRLLSAYCNKHFKMV